VSLNGSKQPEQKNKQREKRKNERKQIFLFCLSFNYTTQYASAFDTPAHRDTVKRGVANFGMLNA